VLATLIRHFHQSFKTDCGIKSIFGTLLMSGMGIVTSPNAPMSSLRNANNVGMVTGEEIESGWARLNHLQYQTREMDSGARADSITIHMIQSNYDKIKAMGASTILIISFYSPFPGQRLISRYSESIKEWKKHNDDLVELEETLNSLDPTIVPGYKEIYNSKGGEQFRPDNTKFNCWSLMKLIERLNDENKIDPSQESQMEVLKNESSETLRSQGFAFAKLANKGVKIEEERYVKP
jgi:hypothetical protein